MIARFASVLVLLALSAAAPPLAQRKAVLDALRPAVEKELGPNVEFVVQVIRGAVEHQPGQAGLHHLGR